MSTSKEYISYLKEQLSLFGEASFRPMMGEYLVYCRDRLIGSVCDGRLLIKPTESALRLLPGAPLEYPYEGSKNKQLVVEDIDDREFLARLFEAAYPELPAKSKRRSGKPDNEPAAKHDRSSVQGGAEKGKDR